MATPKVRKAIIPAAGYGTRLLPATKSIPKEMLPVVDKPVVHYVVEQAVAAGIEEIIFITSSNKHALEDYFDNNFELEAKLQQAGKQEQYEQIRAISGLARFVYVRQKEALGNGHAVLTAKDLVGDEPFLVLWGDEFMLAKPGGPQQLVEAYEQVHAPVIAAMETHNPADGQKFGFVRGEKENNLVRMEELVEKPGLGKAPSIWASVGGYLLTPEIFPILENLPAKNGEIWLSGAINQLAVQSAVYARPILSAIFYDSGSKFGLIKANIELGLQHPETKQELLAYLAQLGNSK